MGYESKKRAGSLTDQVVMQLSSMIESGALAPEAKLPTESEIMLHQGVSRTVVREAISRLQASGLVVTRHGIGTFVLGSGNRSSLGIGLRGATTVRDVLAVLELRISLETEAASLAAMRRTDGYLAELRQTLDSFRDHLLSGIETVTPDFQFHLGIARATENRYFSDILSHLGASLIPRSRFPINENSPREQGYLDRICHEHEDIYSAIKRGDSEGARAAVRTHLVNARERMRRGHETTELTRSQIGSPKR